MKRTTAVSVRKAEVDIRVKTKKRSPDTVPAVRWYFGSDVSDALIRRFVRQVVERFQPDKIILFGSRAYGKTNANSDVDILVVMPAYDETNQAVRILRKTDHPFPLDLIVRTPTRLRWRLEHGDWFLREIVSKGRILYEKSDAILDKKGRKRLRGSKELGKEPSAIS